MSRRFPNHKSETSGSFLFSRNFCEVPDGKQLYERKVDPDFASLIPPPKAEERPAEIGSLNSSRLELGYSRSGVSGRSKFIRYCGDQRMAFSGQGGHAVGGLRARRGVPRPRAGVHEPRVGRPVVAAKRADQAARVRAEIKKPPRFGAAGSYQRKIARYMKGNTSANRLAAASTQPPQ